MYFSNFHSLPEHLAAVSKLSFTYERRAAIIVIVIFTIAQYYGKGFIFFRIFFLINNCLKIIVRMNNPDLCF